METERKVKEERYVIERTGQKNLAFTGFKLESVSTWESNGPHNNRWNDLTMYNTIGGKYILQDEYTTQWQGESNTSKVYIADNPKAAIEKAMEESEYPEVFPEVLKELAKKMNIDFTEEVE